MDAAWRTVTLPDGTAPTTNCSDPLTSAADVEDVRGAVGRARMLTMSVDDGASVMLPRTASVLDVDTESVVLDHTGTLDVQTEPMQAQLGREPQAFGGDVVGVGVDAIVVDAERMMSDATPNPNVEKMSPWPVNVMPSGLVATLLATPCPTVIHNPPPNPTPLTAESIAPTPSPVNASPSLE